MQPMPVLIQPRIDGPGGVYFFDRQSGLDRLELSLRGPGAVTSGTSIVSDQLPVESPSGRMALAACRELARKLGGSGEFELVIPLDCCVFLQYRPLTRPISESLPEGASCDFPARLSPLVGTLWAEQLSAVLGVPEIRYDKGFILGLDDPQADETALSLTPDYLRDAEEYYNRKLFPDWEALYSTLASELERLSPEVAWEKMTDAWATFLDQYFNNPHEGVVNAARAKVPPGMAFSPRTVRRLQLFGQASAAVNAGIAEGVSQRELLGLKAVQNYLDSFGFYLLAQHDFGQPTLAEQPNALIPQLCEAGEFVNPEMKQDDLVLRVAWLAEDDNEFKQRFLSLLRRCVLRLGRHLASQGQLQLEQDIWNLTRGDLAALLRGATVQGPRDWSLARTPLTRPPAGPKAFAAEILAPGRAAGKATLSGSAGPARILVRTAIETADYSLLLGSAGAVVALGTRLSHGAIFARDVGKPLYRCPAILDLVEDGTELTLLDAPPCVRVRGETTSSGELYVD